MFLQHRQRFTHELLTTLLAEVTSLINARPLQEVSTDPNDICILTPATLRIQKPEGYFTHEHEFGPKDIPKSQWKFVQQAETF